MRSLSHIRIVLAFGLIAAAANCSWAQSYTPPPPPLTTLPPCPLGKNGKPDKKQKNCDPTVYPAEKVETPRKKSADAGESAPLASASSAAETPAAQQFPFPGETAKPVDTPPAKAFPFPGSGDVASGGKSQSSTDPNVPHDPEAEKKATNTPAGKAYPYPGDTSAGIPADPDMPSVEKQPDERSSSSSSSSTADSSEPAAENPGNASAAPGPKGEYDDDDSAPSPKLKDKGHKKVPPPQTDTERVDEDLSIAKYYGQSGNRMGAYLRAKDAVKVQPDYAEAHFALGEAAQRLGKKDEASAEFTEYLKLSPDGQQAKTAEKALAEMR